MTDTTLPPTKPVYGASHFDKVASVYENTSIQRNQNPMTKQAHALISSAPPISQTSIIHDNACGPGIIAAEILSQFNDNHNQQNTTTPEANPDIQFPTIYATDISPAMISTLQSKTSPPGIHAVQSSVMDSQNLTFPDDTFTHSFTNMGIFLFPNPVKAASEIYRTLQKGGTAVLSSVKKVGWIRVFQAAERRVVGEQRAKWEGSLGEEWSSGRELVRVLEEGGFEVGKMRLETFWHRSDGMETFMRGMRESVGRVVTEGWTVAEREEWERVVEEEIEKVVREPVDLEVVVWLAVVTK